MYDCEFPAGGRESLRSPAPDVFAPAERLGRRDMYRLGVN